MYDPLHGRDKPSQEYWCALGRRASENQGFG